MMQLTWYPGKVGFEEGCACDAVRARRDGQDMYRRKGTSVVDSTKVCLDFRLVHLDYYYQHY